MNVKGEQLKNTKAILSHWSFYIIFLVFTHEPFAGKFYADSVNAKQNHPFKAVPAYAESFKCQFLLPCVWCDANAFEVLYFSV